MTKQVKAIICEPYSNWYLIRFTDGTVKEKYMAKPYKYVEKFMAEHTSVQIKFGRYGYYA
jgi:hypothetical protein